MSDAPGPSKNLTSLPTRFYEGEEEKMTELLSFLSDAAKPGNYYELHLGRGVCEWKACTMDEPLLEDCRVRVEIHPNTSQLKIRIPEGWRLFVEKYGAY